MYKVTKTDGDMFQTIAACLRHIPRTMQELGTEFVIIEKVTDHDHTCMGCLKGW